jgi:transcription initiation factor TFIID subunit 11
MEHFLNDTSDHNSSFFQPPAQEDDGNDDELDDTMIHSPSAAVAATTAFTSLSTMEPESSPIKQNELTVAKTTDRPRVNRNFDEAANIKLQVLVSNFSDEQLDRYEMYRRSAFSKISIKRLMHTITGSVPSSNVVIAMAGIAKVFVGEIVEEALEVQRRENQSEQKLTPLEPKHLREAYRRIQSQSHCPSMLTWRSKRKSRF